MSGRSYHLIKINNFILHRVKKRQINRLFTRKVRPNKLKPKKS
jgi:hypothetical protein